MTLSAKDCLELAQALGGKALGYRYGDIVRWLRRADCREGPGDGGSHRTWTHPSGKKIPLVDRGAREVLPVYVKRAARVLQEEDCRP